MDRLRRRRGRDGLRPAGPAGADRRHARAVAGGLRRGLRPTPHPRRRDTRQAGLSASATRHQPHRRSTHPAEHRRFPPHEPARGRQLAALRRRTASSAAWSALVGFKQTRWSSTASPGRRRGNYNRFFGSFPSASTASWAFSYALLPQRDGRVSGALSRRSSPRLRVMKLVGVPFPVGNPTIVILISSSGACSSSASASWAVHRAHLRRGQAPAPVHPGVQPRDRAPQRARARARDGRDRHRRVTPRARSASSPAGSGRGSASGSATRPSR